MEEVRLKARREQYVDVLAGWGIGGGEVTFHLPGAETAVACASSF